MLIPMAEALIIIKLCLAAVLGMIIGFEREMQHKPAGLRTHALVCMGAALFSVVSLSFAGDSARVAAGIVTGIGFLGAGAIFHYKDNVRGLTTAADLWVVAAVGLAIGIDMYAAAIITTVLVFLILEYGRIFEEKALNKKRR